MTLPLLRSYLNTLSSGPVNEESHREVERLLADCWPELQITTDDEGFEPYKLHDRTESMTWTPPLLEFDIERHGSTVQGSIYANVHHWIVNTEAGLASLNGDRRRQVGKRDKALRIEPLAAEMAALIVARATDPRLVWKTETKVRLAMGKVIPATNKMTTSSRRRRFRKALEDALRPHGWTMTTTNTFEKTI